jgi:hypothetical protein
MRDLTVRLFYFLFSFQFSISTLVRVTDQVSQPVTYHAVWNYEILALSRVIIAMLAWVVVPLLCGAVGSLQRGSAALARPARQVRLAARPARMSAGAGGGVTETIDFTAGAVRPQQAVTEVRRPLAAVVRARCDGAACCGRRAT